MGRRQGRVDETVHRRPFTPEELRTLLDVAASDAFMHPLITTAACTGLRRGDVCGLRWRDVDLAGGMLTVSTSKTGARVEIPIFQPLHEVLAARRRDAAGEHVFPEAAEMLKQSPDGLTWRFKKIVARAFPDEAPEPRQNTVPAIDLRDEGLRAIEARVPEGPRRRRVADVFRRYCAGASLRDIVAATGYCKATVSNDLHAVQSMVGKPFLPTRKPAFKKAIRSITQTERRSGRRRASVRDWHSLRSTFVTIALSANVPIELVKRITGHATVDVVLKHYFRPGREDFRAVLNSALPDVLTGAKSGGSKPVEDLARLAAKVKDGTATLRDRARLKELAAAL